MKNLRPWLIWTSLFLILGGLGFSYEYFKFVSHSINHGFRFHLKLITCAPFSLPSRFKMDWILKSDIFIEEVTVDNRTAFEKIKDADFSLCFQHWKLSSSSLPNDLPWEALQGDFKREEHSHFFPIFWGMDIAQVKSTDLLSEIKNKSPLYLFADPSLKTWLEKQLLLSTPSVHSKKESHSTKSENPDPETLLSFYTWHSRKILSAQEQGMSLLTTELPSVSITPQVRGLIWTAGFEFLKPSNEALIIAIQELYNLAPEHSQSFSKAFFWTFEKIPPPWQFRDFERTLYPLYEDLH